MTARLQHKRQKESLEKEQRSEKNEGEKARARTREFVDGIYSALFNARMLYAWPRRTYIRYTRAGYIVMLLFYLQCCRARGNYKQRESRNLTRLLSDYRACSLQYTRQFFVSSSRTYTYCETAAIIRFWCVCGSLF